MESTRSRYHVMARISWIAALAIYVPLVVLALFPNTWNIQ